MKINLSGKNIVLPISYQYYLQGLFYNLVTKKFDYLHDEGIIVDSKTMKPFSYSKIFCKRYEVKDNSIYFGDEIWIYFSSPFEILLEEFLEKLTELNNIRIGNNFLNISSIRRLRYTFDNYALVKTLSPILVYEKVLRVNGERKLLRYNPKDPEFCEIIKYNMSTKGKALGINTETFNIIPQRINPTNKRVLKYKTTTFEAWEGTYKIYGNNEVLKLAFDWGLGLRNSQGFGMIETI
ncbi:CRISPR-associated endoribonuclease Cas6 [Tepiditoga spiralis]|uniref:CRISPR-associated endoribonuclease Cas6 n=1 Tax=Tepiditoga spiralis TaxID=2108365 RepID=UPI001E393236|nr:CRISPR-associated endoribonuclease Cas6 [Tepiditoga spiralis]